jgi:hypothetical protein
VVVVVVVVVAATPNYLRQASQNLGKYGFIHGTAPFLDKRPAGVWCSVHRRFSAVFFFFLFPREESQERGLCLALEGDYVTAPKSSFSSVDVYIELENPS